MFRFFALLSTAILLCACNENPGIRVTNQAALAEVQSRPRNEPIFYNGKTYQFALNPTGQGTFALSVSPMSAKQEKDATAVATSALRYFACPEGQTGKLSGKPSHDGTSWNMTAVCG